MDLLALIQAVLTALGLFALPVTDSQLDTFESAEVVRVIDGDTIEVALAGEFELVRYIGIDTPEAPRSSAAGECGHAAATALNRSLVENAHVRLVSDIENRDRFGRLLRYVYVEADTEEVFVNQALLDQGLASPLSIAPNTRHAEWFTTRSQAARVAGRGNWTTCSQNR